MAKRKQKSFYGPLHHVIENEQKALAYRKRFYSDSKDFKVFEDLDDETIKKIKDVLAKLFPESLYPKNSFKRYISILKYLLSSKENKEFKTFDQKIIFLIMGIDPELSIYFHYLRNGYSINSDYEVRNRNAYDLISFIQKVVGSFDVQLLKYEEVYFRRFLKCGDIISFVNIDCSSSFFDSFKNITSFRDISDVVFQIILNKAEYYLSTCENPNNVNTICFNMNNPNSVLELWHILYKVIFFISVIDPDFKALKIYAEESNVINIKERMIQELGFYHEDFIKVEELYRRRFYPGLKVSEWTL